MELSAQLIALLIQFCPWYITALPNVSFAFTLTPSAYEMAERTRGYEKGTTEGFALWAETTDGLRDCRIILREPASLGIACHEYRHCAKGHFHD